MKDPKSKSYYANRRYLKQFEPVEIGSPHHVTVKFVVAAKVALANRDRQGDRIGMTPWRLVKVYCCGVVATQRQSASAQQLIHGAPRSALCSLHGARSPHTSKPEHLWNIRLSQLKPTCPTPHDLTIAKRSRHIWSQVQVRMGKCT